MPAIVNGIEGLCRSVGSRENRGDHILRVSLQLSDAVTSRHIVDESKFKEDLSKVTDGRVLRLNASTWSKPAQS